MYLALVNSHPEGMGKSQFAKYQHKQASSLGLHSG
jgi:hypothetical protein